MSNNACNLRKHVPKYSIKMSPNRLIYEPCGEPATSPGCTPHLAQCHLAPGPPWLCDIADGWMDVVAPASMVGIRHFPAPSCEHFMELHFVFSPYVTAHGQNDCAQIDQTRFFKIRISSKYHRHKRVLLRSCHYVGNFLRIRWQLWVFLQNKTKAIQEIEMNIKFNKC